MNSFSVAALGCDAAPGVATGPRAATDTSAVAVVSSPTIPSGAAHADVPGDETTGTARVLLEQTAARTGLGGSTREADPVLGPASRLLDGERDTAHVLEHAGGIRISA